MNRKQRWVESYADTARERIDLVFAPERAPTLADSELSGNHLVRCLAIAREAGTWRALTLNEMTSNFGADFSTDFARLSWSELFVLSPLLIGLAYEAYPLRDPDGVLPVAEGVFCLFPSSRRPVAFSNWLGMFTKMQIATVLEFLAFMNLDVLGHYPDAFTDGQRWWTAFYLNARSH